MNYKQKLIESLVEKGVPHSDVIEFAEKVIESCKKTEKPYRGPCRHQNTKPVDRKDNLGNLVECISCGAQHAGWVVYEER